MNTALFRSGHALGAALLVGACAGYAALRGAPFGRVAGLDRGFLLATGWAAAATLVVVTAYVLRKYAHRGGYSPEFKLRVPFEALERANKRINALRQRILGGALATRAAIEHEARAILVDEGVHKVNRVLVERGVPGGDPWTVRIVPTEPLGRVAGWMHAHLFYGLAFGALLWMHSGFVLRSWLGWALAGVGALVWASGLLGILLWARGPRWLTRAERDLSIEEAEALAESLAKKRAAAVDALDPAVRRRVLALGRGRQQPPAAVSGLVRELAAAHPGDADAVRDVVALVHQERAVRAERARLRRVRATFMAWRFAHVPAAVLLAGLVALHVLVVWMY